MQESQSVRLCYENTVDDAVALSKFHNARSPTARRNQRIGAVIVMLSTMLASLLVFGSSDLSATLLNGLIAYSMIVLFSLGYHKLTGDRLIRKQYLGDNNRNFLGLHELELTDEGIHYRTEYNEGRMAWGLIERIESTPDHTFLFLGTANAMIIPHDRITEGSYSAFLKELGQRFQPDQKLQPLKELA